MTPLNIQQVMIRLIVSNEHKSYGFCKMLSTGEEAFIPPHIIKTMRHKHFDVTYAELEESNSGVKSHLRYKVKMFHDEDGPFGHLLKRYKHEPEPEPATEVATPAPQPVRLSSKDLSAMIAERLDAAEGQFISTAEVGDLVKDYYGHRVSTQRLASVMDWMEKRGEIAKVQLTKGKARASRIVWHCLDGANETFDAKMELENEAE